ncbi:hypothetical protein BC827DRAFT_1139736, partial [Russula dissimulans]
IKIKGQAEAERQRNKMENAEAPKDREDLSRRESELKEKALRNKVVRTRKRTASDPLTESYGTRDST